MEKLYRDFVLIALLFIIVTFILNFAPILKSCVDDKREKMRHLPCEKQTHKIDRKKSYLAGSVWDTDSGDDRIVQQMNLHKYRDIVIAADDFNEPLGNDKFIKDECYYQNCKLIRGHEHGSTPDARIFNTNVNLNGLKQFYRTPEQVWILYILEGPLATPDYFLFDNIFNWTATYRWDSTIVAPYEKWVSFNNGTKPIKKNYANGKTKQCAIFVSNCDTTNRRLAYVRELQKHIDVDIYGSCGNKRCDRTDENKCFDMLSRDYKFYLAFENSNCRDYITEKFFRNGLMQDVLPVVMGAHPTEYKRAAPPNSYLHVENFTSPEDLAKFLHKLDKNDDLYNKYFQWKGSGSFINTKFWCRLCALLNYPKMPHLSVKHLHSWWRTPSVCIRDDQRWSDT
ncbi:hypothetical protein FSP39_020195 [Pinctada imbricata]|uniref:Fucosyltransferase n=1 Tax=Pinctada imbricata TaxID=66713 RepID=A0AA88Y7A0_PINIB|nr:hypothetical protein FSP39_020195 [Pinctada imbricata]